MTTGPETEQNNVPRPCYLPPACQRLGKPRFETIKAALRIFISFLRLLSADTLDVKMSRFMTFWLLLLAIVSMVLAAPFGNVTIESLEKRITHTGRATWFEVGLGNCGYRDKDSDPVIAMSKAFYNANKGINCNQWIAITDPKSKKTKYGKMRDSCPGCGYYDLDLSPSLFKEFHPTSVGVFQMQWNFMPRGWQP